MPGKNTLSAVDSLAANEFAVEIDGEEVKGVFRVSGLTPFKLNLVNPSAAHLARDPFILSKMVQHDPNTPFNRWLRETVAARGETRRPRRSIAIIAIDDGREIRRWVVTGAYITQVTYSEFNTSSSELVEEIATINYDDIEETWPAVS